MKGGLAIGAGTALGTGLSLSQGQLLDALTAHAATPFSPGAVKHIVILMQENRSFDHYFGTLSGVHGFRDPFAGQYPGNAGGANPFRQAGPVSALPGWTGPVSNGQAVLEPWQLVSSPPFHDGQSTNDITHDWTPQHQVYNGGRMDRWFAVHAANDKNNVTNPTSSATSNDGYMTMGYLRAPDLAFYHALADAFTICDGYFCSVLGPTDPNRLMLMSNSVGIGQTNGPLLTTLVQTRPSEFGKFSWKTMPEALNDAGVSWKIYGDPTAQLLFNVLPYFKQYQNNSALATNAFGWQYPGDFAADVAAGALPPVSWLLPSAANCEHPAAPPSNGEDLVHQILTVLASNPAVWGATVFFVIYDENGGWFDHVPPPTAPHTAQNEAQGEWLTTATNPSPATYVNGPVGLGFRTPCLILSPFSRGGYLCSPYYRDSNGHVRIDPAGTFDHTSINRFISAVFGAQGKSVALPNLSQWRKSATGDFTRAFAGVDDPSIPTLPQTATTEASADAQAVINAMAGTVEYAPQPYPPPTSNSFPPQPDDTTVFKKTLH